MKFNCPNCTKTLKVSDGAEGRKGSCPQCGKLLIVPAPDGANKGGNNGNGVLNRTVAKSLAPPKEENRNSLNRKDIRSGKAVNIEESDFWSYINEYIQNVIQSDNPDQIFLKRVGFWWRCFQYVIDMIPVVLLLYLFSRPIGRFTAYFQDQTDMLLFGKIALTTIFVLLMLLYWSIMESSRFQGSLGKIVLDFKVTDTYGQPVSFTSALIRNCLKILQFMPPLFLLFALIMFSKNKQGLHDRFADTLVVLDDQGVIWYYERRWIVLWLVLFLPFGLSVLAL